MQKLLTVEEVAGIFRVSPRTVSRWVKDGKVRSIKVGRTVRIPSDAVDALLRGDASSAPGGPASPE